MPETPPAIEHHSRIPAIVTVAVAEFSAAAVGGLLGSAITQEAPDPAAVQQQQGEPTAINTSWTYSVEATGIGAGLGMVVASLAMAVRQLRRRSRREQARAARQAPSE